jgi:spore germination protein KB
MIKQQLTARQATLWIVMYQVGSGFLIIPSPIVAIAKQDAWLSALLSLAFHLLWIPLYFAIANRMKGQSLVMHLGTVLGKRGGKLFALLFILFVPYMIFIMTLRNIGDFLSTSIMPETPEDAIYLLMLIAVFCAVRAGAAVIGRSAEVLFLVVPLLYAIVATSLLPSVEISNPFPVFEYGWKPIVQGSFLLLAFPYLETFLFLFLVHNVGDPAVWRKSVVRSSLISGGMYVGMILLVIAVLGEGVTSDLTFASYFVVRTISIGDFIQRFEIVVTIFWYISIFFRLTLLMYVSVHGLAGVFRLTDAKVLTIPLLLLALIMAHSIWPNTLFLTELYQVWPLYAMVFGIAVPLVVWLLGFRRDH